MFTDEHEFEDEVRRIARLLWPGAQYGGAEMEDGRERDGIFESDDFVHVIECTVSRSKQKAVEDLQKIQKLVRKLEVRYSNKFVKGWFITLHEPTADQRAVYQKVRGRIVAVSFDQFRAQLVDARTYLDLRRNYPFGSVRDPETGTARTDLDYVTLDVLDSSERLYSVADISNQLLKGGRFVLLGDYGAGKSATLRQVYLQLSSMFLASTTLLFPILLNLRDHHGQTEPVEALERHGRRVGFPQPERLVRAWRAGFVLLLLDGFDEIATAGWAGKTKKLKDLRFRSMELVRSFLRETPRGHGAMLAGRAHFFDSDKEMTSALALDSRYKTLNISEFNDQQLTAYLARMGWTEAVPDWIPSRPLLLGYLASRNLLRDTLNVEAGSSPAAGWNALLERICEREAEIEAGIDAGTVRHLIEHLASVARNSVDGLGPLSPDQVTGAFSTVCGYPPDDRGAVLLQRLPGLGGHRSEDGSRVFIDADFAEAARGSAVASYIEAPFSAQLEAHDWQNCLARLGAEVAAARCVEAHCTPAKISAALEHAYNTLGSHTLSADVLLVLNEMRAGYTGPKIFIRDVILPQIDLDDVEFQSVEFQTCIFGTLDLPPDVSASKLPTFLRCHFGVVEGRTGFRDLPETFEDCSADAFDSSAQTTNAILALSLPLGAKVVLSILKKLYSQKGSGRRESALYKGLDVRAQQLVAPALALLRRENFAIRTRQGAQYVWLPTRSSGARRRALTMLAGPNTAQDEVLRASRELG